MTTVIRWEPKAPEATDVVHAVIAKTSTTGAATGVAWKLTFERILVWEVSRAKPLLIFFGAFALGPSCTLADYRFNGTFSSKRL